jgi:hypothetical protein
MGRTFSIFLDFLPISDFKCHITFEMTLGKLISLLLDSVYFDVKWFLSKNIFK